MIVPPDTSSSGAPHTSFGVRPLLACAIAELLKAPAGLLNDDRLGRLLLSTLDRFDVDASRLPAKVRLAMASMGKPDTKVSELCKEVGISRQTLYRHVSPDGEARPDGMRVLARKCGDRNDPQMLGRGPPDRRLGLVRILSLERRLTGKLMRPARHA